ncbi:hypothetical protein [Microbacterium sp. bgisy203]|uniref:hypothetical protein n=1 Tax=Microbacterium sp. bgisy203 TaxID=3413799 RepID=UPI003D721D93
MRDGTIPAECEEPHHAETPRRGDLEYGEPTYRFHNEDADIDVYDVPVTGPGGFEATVVVDVWPDDVCVATVNGGD